MRGILTALVLLAATPLAADEIETGRELYLSRCASCHGPLALGDGPMAAMLIIPVPDLTGLRARNDGVFPRVEVVRTIDGRAPLAGHGGGGPMPVFGPILGGGSAVLDGSDGLMIETRGDVVSIARYLETIQGD